MAGHILRRSAALLLLPAALLAPTAVRAQPEPALGVSVARLAGFDGGAWEELGAGTAIGVEGRVRLGRSWDVGLALGRSDHAYTSGLPVSLDLWRLTAGARRTFRLPGLPLEPFVGGRLGLAVVDYDTSRLAVFEIALAPGARVTDADESLAVEPEAGLRLPLGRRFAVELRGSFLLADVDPVIVPASPPDEWSRALGVGLALDVRL